ncbi:N-acetylmuramoyl-L-alanine amidase [Sutcliffiella rhizosphaerae]|uniref:N-acetylmuramoyl-L-alanine amidase n=1 Tax=Sutcliffiella rhizosphaerae TaxID=2880967 RepID=A0ABM8YM79_9BACI|nr:N-acetylmuramoyl-L-alanine amidase [Sutcliffiella rhizosphaerae]CAG9620932.1 hypothetical protein BACCIP111883_01704 [Sutcliffiella rhizosphaerae]
MYTYFKPIIIAILLLSGCSFKAVEVTEVEKETLPIVEDNNAVEHLEGSQIEMTAWFLPKKNSRVRGGSITHIMLHFTNNALHSPEDPYKLEEVYALFEEYEVSAHYMIDRDGEIYYLVPEERAAYHAGKGYLLNFQDYVYGLNDHSIGIELLAIGTKEEMGLNIPDDIYDLIQPVDIGYTDAQYEALNILLEDILRRNPGIKHDREHIIGHDEYARVRKSDPGSLFEWDRIGF